MMVTLEDLLQRHPVWRGGAAFSRAAAVPSGFSVLDGELPGGGWPTGGLTEILGLQQGIGELRLLLPALAALTTAGKRVIWLAPPHLPYAPALAAAGVDLARLAVVRAPGRRDSLWAAEQALRSGTCHALLAWFRNARYAELRRLALPREAARESSPACLRIALEPVQGELAVRILKRRGAPAAAPLRVPLKSPLHALGRSPSSPPASGDARARRSLGLPVHA